MGGDYLKEIVWACIQSHPQPGKAYTTHDLTTSVLRTMGWLGVYLNASGLLGGGVIIMLES